MTQKETLFSHFCLMSNTYKKVIVRYKIHNPLKPDTVTIKDVDLWNEL